MTRLRALSRDAHFRRGARDMLAFGPGLAAGVNLRSAIFSSQWRAHLGHLPRGRRLVLGYLLADLNLLVFRKQRKGDGHKVGQARYAAGGAVAVWIVWQATSIAGILLSSLVPLGWGLGFAGTFSMLGIAYSTLADRTAWVAAVVSAAAAVYARRPGVLGPLVAGLGVYLPLRRVRGW